MTVDNQHGHVTLSRLNISLVRDPQKLSACPVGHHISLIENEPPAGVQEASPAQREGQDEQGFLGTRGLPAARLAEGSGEHKGQSSILLLLPLLPLSGLSVGPLVKNRSAKAGDEFDPPGPGTMIPTKLPWSNIAHMLQSLKSESSLEHLCYN